MNASRHLRLWAEEWNIQRTMAEDETLFAVPAPAEIPAAERPGLMVGAESDIAGLLLEELRGSIHPDIATEALRRHRHTVRAGGELLPADLLECGQILQMKPGVTPGTTRAVFALVEKIDSEKNSVLLVPFGPVSLPALPSELDSGLPDEALKVLCLWNAQWIPAGLAARSWEVMRAPGELLGEIATLRNCLSLKTPLPADLAGRTGPALQHPEDPRHRYLQSEESLWLDG